MLYQILTTNRNNPPYDQINNTFVSMTHKKQWFVIILSLIPF